MRSIIRLSRFTALSAALISATLFAHGALAAPQYGLIDLGPLLNQTTPPAGVGGGGFPGTGNNSTGIAMNKNGNVIGAADSYISEEYQPSGGTATTEAEDITIGFVYDGKGAKQALMPIEFQPGATLPTSPPNDYCYVGGLNSSKEAVGATNYELQTDGRSIQHAIIWSGTKTTDLGDVWQATAATQTTGSQADDGSDALAINDADEIVGYGQLSDGEDNAWIYKNGAMTDINTDIYAGELYNTQSTYSIAEGVNKNGLIVGDHYFYTKPGSPIPNYNGYFPFIYDPSTGVTTPLLCQYGYTDSLNVVGTEENGDQDGASINDSGEAAFSGIVPGTGQPTGILYDSGVYTDIGAEKDEYGNSYANYDTWTHGIGDTGDVVGGALISANAQHHITPTGPVNSYVGIVWHNGKIYNLNDVVSMPPGYYIMDAKAVDADGDIVATAVVTSGSGYRAVLLKLGGAYTITDLGTSSAVGINKSGQLIGSAGLWTPTTANGATSTAGFVALPLMPSGINTGGQVAGTVGATVGGKATFEAALWSPTVANGSTGSLTSYDVIGTGKAPGSNPPTITNNLFGVTAQAFGTGINSIGQLVGESSTKDIYEVLQSIEDVSGTDYYTNDYYDLVDGVTSAGTKLVADGDVNGVQYQSGVGINLEAYPTVDPSVTPPPFTDCPGFSGINVDSEKVGWTCLYYEQTLDGSVQENLYDSAAVYVKGTTVTPIPTLDQEPTSNGGPSQHPQDYAFAINDNGAVVGQSESEVGYGPVQHAFLWDGDDFYLDLGALPGLSSTNTLMPPGQVVSTAFAVNDNDQAVGWSCIGPLGSGAHAVLFNGDSINDLNYDIPNSGWTFQQANGINNAGQIVGEGLIGGKVHGFLLTPK